MRQTPQSIILRCMFLTYLTILILLGSLALLSPIPRPPTLHQINLETSPLLHSLIKTKYFRMIRINLNRQCQLYVRNRICRSQSCTVCRCDEKDIPMNWIRTDKVKEEQGGQVDIWEKERTGDGDISWVWHVEDEENDEGEYFDLYDNIESFTNYNGSTIWNMIYEENCFPKRKSYKQDQMCKQEEVFYKVISGLHTSISTHLSIFYKNSTSSTQMWADLKSSDKFYINASQYHRRVLSHPQRIQNLLFIYQIYLRAIKQIAPYLSQSYSIHSQNISQDLLSVQLLQSLCQKFTPYQFRPFDQELKPFFYPSNPKVQQFQRYIHNISRLMNCVECEKCRLFGKMQTYGIGTALKILLGYNSFYKRNQVVALFNAWNKISMAVAYYYQHVKPESLPLTVYDFFWMRLVATAGGALLLFLTIINQFNLRAKIKHLFKRVKFPSQRQAGVPYQYEKQKKLN